LILAGGGEYRVTSIVESAIPVFVQFARSNDRALVAALVSSVCDKPTAARLVAFMPLAFARALLGDSGVKLSGTFVRSLARRGLFTEIPLAGEPVFAAADVARAGVGREEMLAIAGRSAEFHAINHALLSGSKLEDLECAPPVLMWDYNCEPVTARRRRLWHVWRRDG
jgi:hypothetical protein